MSSSFKSENKECKNFTLIAPNHSDDEQEVCDFEINDKLPYKELQNAFLELYEEHLTLSRTFAKQKKITLSLESKANDTQKEFVKSSFFNIVF